MEFKSSMRGPKGSDANLPKRVFSALCAAMAVLVLFGAPIQGQTRAVHSTAEPAAAGSASHRFKDEMGRWVDVPTDVRRIVSLAPNLTEVVFALREGDRLAGDTDFCDYPAEAARKPRVGGPVNPNIEQIVALSPDLILATKSINRRETVEALDRLGLPVYVTDPHTVDGMIASIERLGNVLHAEKAAVPLVENLRGRLSDLDRRLAGTVPRRALLVVWTDPLISIGRGTFLADALRRAGAQSVVDTTEEWPRVSLEEIVRLQPEFVVFTSAHDGNTQPDIDALRARPGWRDLTALRAGKVVVTSDAINRPSPRMVDAIEQLARTLHSESFTSRERRSERATHVVREACACTH